MKLMIPGIIAVLVHNPQEQNSSYIQYFTWSSKLW